MSHSTWFFNRKRGIDRAAFAKFMEDEWVKRPTFGMIAYPEGTRNRTNEPLALKTGVLQFAYEYKHPVQCVITTGKEHVCNERTMSMARNQSVYTACSEVIDPESFDAMDKFVAQVREAFAGTWKAAHAENREVEEYNPPMGQPSPPVYAAACEPSKVRMLRVLGLVILLIAVGSANRGVFN